MSDDTTTELERLRADLEALDRISGLWVFTEGFRNEWFEQCEKLRDKIARLEAEAADPRTRGKAVLLECSRLDSQKHPEKWHVINLVTHLTAENERLAARVAELEAEKRIVKNIDVVPLKPRDVSAEFADLADEPVLDPHRVLATAIVVCVKEGHGNVADAIRGVRKYADPYRLKGGENGQ